MNTSETVKSEHTPTPFRIGDGGWTIFGPPNGKPAPAVIATMEQGTSMGPLERRANAQFIVTACNAHDVLLDACKAILEKYLSGELCLEDFDQVKAAISLATNT